MESFGYAPSIQAYIGGPLFLLIKEHSGEIQRSDIPRLIAYEQTKPSLDETFSQTELEQSLNLLIRMRVVIESKNYLSVTKRGYELSRRV